MRFAEKRIQAKESDCARKCIQVKFICSYISQDLGKVPEKPKTFLISLTFQVNNDLFLSAQFFFLTLRFGALVNLKLSLFSVFSVVLLKMTDFQVQKFVKPKKKAIYKKKRKKKYSSAQLEKSWLELITSHSLNMFDCKYVCSCRPTTKKVASKPQTSLIAPCNFSELEGESK